MSIRKVRLGHRVNDVICYPLISDETGKVYSHNGVYALTNLFNASRENVMFGNIRDVQYLLPFGEGGATYICAKQTVQEGDSSFLVNAVPVPPQAEWRSVFTCEDGKHNMYHGSLLTFAEDNSKLSKTEPETNADMSQYRRARRGTIFIYNDIYYTSANGERMTLQRALELLLDGSGVCNEGYDTSLMMALCPYGVEERIDFYDVNEDTTTVTSLYPKTITTGNGTVYTRGCNCSFYDNDVLYFDDENRPVNVKKAVIASIVSTENDRCVIAPSVLKIPENLTRYERPNYAFPKDTIGDNLMENTSTAYYNTMNKSRSNVLEVLGEVDDTYLVRILSLYHEYNTANNSYDENILMEYDVDEYFIKKDGVHILSDFETLLDSPRLIVDKLVDGGIVNKVIAMIPETGECLAEGCLVYSGGTSLLHIVSEDDVIFL